jgi:transketolase
MGMADIATVLWREFMKYNPTNPRWWNRDRFILSNGHACMLQYAALNLTGYAAVTMDEIKRFRQLGSHLAGHPEFNLDLGIETTSGPLGQGLANSVGFALAENMLAKEFNRPDFPIVDHITWVFMGDGCLMEGISHEACSLAGALSLGKLIGFYDNNGISIDGQVKGWFTDDTNKRFEAYGWHVQEVDGLDGDAVAAAIRAALAETARPSLINCRTIIGWPAPHKQGTKEAHGEALGADEVAATKKILGWTAPPFEVPEPLRAAWDQREAGRAAEASWQELFGRYQKAYPDLAAEFERRMRSQLPGEWPSMAQATLQAAQAVKDPQATRKSSGVVLNVIAPTMPELFGGSADLTPSNDTWTKVSRAITREDMSGNYLHYGVREFAMTAAMNGIALHGGFVPYGGTFLTFSDYARNAVRMAALMHQRVILVYTHDSIGLGEDGPTHQPIEHLNSLRLIPNLTLWRPADAVESAIAWQAAIEHDSGPTALVFTRQNVPQLARSAAGVGGIRRGGYVLLDCQGTPECLVMATGSEVQLGLEAVQRAQAAGRRVRLISLPCWQVFDRQEAGYRESVLPAAVKARVAVEAGTTGLWWRYVGEAGRVIGIDRFGSSGKGPEVLKYFGFTADHVYQAIEESLARKGS